MPGGDVLHGDRDTELRAHIRELADWVDVLAGALLEQRRHIRLDHVIATVEAPKAAAAARECAGVTAGPMALSAQEVLSDESR